MFPESCRTTSAEKASRSRASASTQGRAPWRAPHRPSARHRSCTDALRSPLAVQSVFSAYVAVYLHVPGEETGEVCQERGGPKTELCICERKEGQSFDVLGQRESLLLS